MNRGLSQTAEQHGPMLQLQRLFPSNLSVHVFFLLLCASCIFFLSLNFALIIQGRDPGTSEQEAGYGAPHHDSA